MRYLPVFVFLFLLVVVTSCTKEKFPRITKFKLVNDPNCLSNRALEIIDLSDIPDHSFGIQYSPTESFPPNPTNFYPRHDKGSKQCLVLPKINCSSIIYLRPFCKEGDQYIYGPIDTLNIFTLNFVVANITSINISNNVSELIVNYKLPDLTNVGNIEGIYLYYSVNSKNEVTINDSSVEIKDTSLKSYTLKSIQKGSTYKFKLFIKICGSYKEFSAEKTITVPPDNSLCIINFGAITFQQKSTLKVLLTGSIIGNPSLQDFGFCIDGCNNKKISCKNQSFSIYNSIFSGINGNSYNCKLYIQCVGESTLKEGPESNFTIKSPNISIDSPIYNASNKTISLSGRFNISNYPSIEYGVCYSAINSVPNIGNSTKKILGPGIVPISFISTISSIVTGSTYYIRFYIQDCDEILYSEVKSIHIDISQPRCNVTITNIENFQNGTNYAAAFILNGNLYVGGGLGNQFTSPPFYMFNGQYWIRTTDVPIGSTSINNGGIAAYFTIDNKAYILKRNTSNFYCFDPSNNQWNSVASYYGNREYCTGASTGSRGYIIGGKWTNSPMTDNSIREYIASGNKWVQRTYDNKLGARIKSGSFVINNIIYIFGGEGQGADNKLWSYDTESDTWTQNQYSLLPGLMGFVAGLTFVFNGRGYVIMQDSSDVYEFDPSVGWSKCSVIFNSKRQYGFGVYNSTSAFIGLGSTSNGLSNEVFMVN